jgi:ABC-type uncharacterized transport system permease subunit
MLISASTQLIICLYNIITKTPIPHRVSRIAENPRSLKGLGFCDTTVRKQARLFRSGLKGNSGARRAINLYFPIY